MIGDDDDEGAGRTNPGVHRTLYQEITFSLSRSLYLSCAHLLRSHFQYPKGEGGGGGQFNRHTEYIHKKGSLARPRKWKERKPGQNDE
jgi:hypothetical protein